MQDKHNVKNIIVLQRPSGSTVNAENAFINQTVPLNNIIELVTKEDEIAGTKPTNGNQNSWVDSTAALDADRRPVDLIIISLPKKFNVPKTANTSDKTSRVTQRVPVGQEDDDQTANASTSKDQKSMATSNTPNEPQAIIGGFYEPSLLPDYNPEDFNLVKNKLVQHNILDIEENIMPTWKIEHGLRPGTVIMVSATLHVFNIDNTNFPGYRRYYQINAEKIMVLAKPLPIDPVTPPQQLSVPRKSDAFDDFALFTPKKRREENEPDEHTSKKTKTQTQNVVEEEYDLMDE